jgi:predicted dehydrogenase
MSAPVAALVGAGAIAPFHVKALREAGFVIDHVAAMVGSTRGQEFAKEYEIPRYWSDPLELIASDDWDVIVLASSTEGIPELLSHVVKRGKPCLVEKPVAFDGDTIRTFLPHESRIRVAYNRRFYSSAIAAKEFANNGPCLFRMELPDSIQSEDAPLYGLRAVRENSVHGFDLLRYIVGPVKIENRFDVSSPRGRIAIVTTNQGHVGTISLNWNCPVNFSLVLDRAPRRFEMRPFEVGALYEGMEVLEPTTDVPVRRYVPKLIHQSSAFPGPDGVKPGFLEQATALMQRLRQGTWDDRCATLQDAAAAADLAKHLTS